MNLSALNNLPANSLTGTASETSAATTVSERTKSSSISGADFANFLHNQVQAVRNTMRPHLAASDKALPPSNSNVRNEPNAKSDPRESDHVEANTDKADAHNNKKASAKHSSVKETQGKDTESTDSVREVNTDAEDIAKSPLSDQSSSLTTIAVSENLQIITAAKTSANEQSLADFALAMGLDPNQVKSLFGESAANAATAKLSTNNISSQQMLGLNTMSPLSPLNEASAADAQGKLLNASSSELGNMLSNVNKPISTADFQELKTQSPAPNSPTDALLSKIENLQFQMGAGAVAQPTQNTQQPVSTLAVLSMMDAHLRTEDIEALKKEFDAGLSTDSPLNISNHAHAEPLPNLPNRANTNNTSQAAPAFANQPDLAQTYDNLSQKLSTELAARMHEKLNAGEWKMKFALKPASLGLVDVQLEMKDGKLSAHFQSDTNLTQDLLQNGSQRLKDALADLGLNNASVFVAQGESQRQTPQGSSDRSGTSTQADDNHEKLSEESGLKIAEDSLPRRSNRSQFDSYA